MTTSDGVFVNRRAALLLGLTASGCAFNERVPSVRRGRTEDLVRWLTSVAVGESDAPLRQFMTSVDILHPVVVKVLASGARFDFSGVQLRVPIFSKAAWGERDAVISFFGDQFTASGIELQAFFRSPALTGVAYVSGVGGRFYDCSLYGLGWVGLSIGGSAAGACSDTFVANCFAGGCRFGFFGSGSSTVFRLCYATHQWSQSAEFPDGRWRPESHFYDGFVLSRGRGALLDRCVAIDCGQSGVYVGAYENVSIIGGEYSRNFNKGVDFGPSAPASASDVFVSGVRCLNNATGNIHLFNVRNGRVSGCYVRDELRTFALSVDGVSKDVSWVNNDFSSSGRVVFVGDKVIRASPEA
ncbi:right-handed parallel beta-helix repeat-containing protein [Pseudaquabacterium rugosum]|uniref:Right-handed parallel beta-helix repeat-containing protein n=1 Tax=Pseudaquabacterium rugosum TaxID=2984194 RepID=A0ABU9B7H7_9BURK